VHELDRSFPLTRTWTKLTSQPYHSILKSTVTVRRWLSRALIGGGKPHRNERVSKTNRQYRMIALERVPSAQEVDRTLLRSLSPVSEPAGLHARRCCGSWVDGGIRRSTATMGRLILARCILSSSKSYTMPHRQTTILLCCIYWVMFATTRHMLRDPTRYVVDADSTNNTESGEDLYRMGKTT
jgi:hypothetical protein